MLFDADRVFKPTTSRLFTTSSKFPSSKRKHVLQFSLSNDDGCAKNVVAMTKVQALFSRNTVHANVQRVFRPPLFSRSTVQATYELLHYSCKVLFMRHSNYTVQLKHCSGKVLLRRL